MRLIDINSKGGALHTLSLAGGRLCGLVIFQALLPILRAKNDLSPNYANFIHLLLHKYIKHHSFQKCVILIQYSFLAVNYSTFIYYKNKDYSTMLSTKFGKLLIVSTVLATAAIMITSLSESAYAAVAGGGGGGAVGGGISGGGGGGAATQAGVAGGTGTNTGPFVTLGGGFGVFPSTSFPFVQALPCNGVSQGAGSGGGGLVAALLIYKH